MLIISAGSPSTLIAVAGFCLANNISAATIKSGSVRLVITQAFQVGPDSTAYRAVENLDESEQVVLIGLPVNNKGAGPELTKNLLRAIGCRLAGIYDEHEPERWEKLEHELSLPKDLFHTPGKGDGHLSAASIIGSAFEIPQLWLQAGDWADNRDLLVPAEAKTLASAIDGAVKVRMGDNLFRQSVILHLLGDADATLEFEQRCSEVHVLEANTASALAAAYIVGKVLVVRKTANVEINQTAAMFQGYLKAPFVAVVGEKSGAGGVVTVGCDTKDSQLGQTDLLEVFRAAGLEASGISCTATVSGEESLEAVLGLLNALI